MIEAMNLMEHENNIREGQDLSGISQSKKVKIIFLLLIVIFEPIYFENDI
jgi:hypothetical protein